MGYPVLNLIATEHFSCLNKDSLRVRCPLNTFSMETIGWTLFGWQGQLTEAFSPRVEWSYAMRGARQSSELGRAAHVTSQEEENGPFCCGDWPARGPTTGRRLLLPYYLGLGTAPRALHKWIHSRGWVLVCAATRFLPSPLLLSGAPLSVWPGRLLVSCAPCSWPLPWPDGHSKVLLAVQSSLLQHLLIKITLNSLRLILGAKKKLFGDAFICKEETSHVKCISGGILGRWVWQWGTDT